MTPSLSARDEFERRYPNAMPILEALERTVARLQADNERMRLLYEIIPPEKNAVELMDRYRAALEEIRDIEPEQAVTRAWTICDQALRGTTP